MAYSFRCGSCGRLEHGDHAAEAVVPHACRVCSAGVSFDPRTGIKKFHPENWEDLSEVSEERLEELGLTADDVEKHIPWEKGATPREPTHISATATEGVSGRDLAN